MKAVWKLMAALAVLIIVGCGSSTNESIVGTWSGTGTEGLPFNLEFAESGDLTIVENQNVVNGNAIGGSLQWRLEENLKDDSGDYITLVIEANGEALNKTKQRWVRLLGPDKMEYAVGDKGSSEEESFVLLSRSND